MKRSLLESQLLVGQGAYYLFTGVWPLLDIRTFQMVTGPKWDRWLVKTVGVLIAVIGGVLMLAGVRRARSPEIALLATGGAAGLMAIDTVYVARKRISPIYLLDAGAELALLGAWAYLRGPRLTRDIDGNPMNGDDNGKEKSAKEAV